MNRLILCLVLALSISLEAAPRRPHLTSYAPVPTAGVTMQTLHVRGSGFTVSMKSSIGTITHVTSTAFDLQAVFDTPGGLTFTVTNVYGVSSSLTITVLAPVPVPPMPTPAVGLVRSLTYIGSVRLPEGAQGDPNGNGFAFGGDPIAFNPAHQSLFITGRNGAVSEVALPTPTSSPTLAGLPVATVLQPFADPTEGHFNPLGTSGSVPAGLGGLLVINGRLHASGYIYYDANNDTRASHFERSTDLRAPSFSGWQAVGPVDQQGFVGRALAAVPAAWQAQLGGSVLASGWGLPILTRQSAGPNAIAFDPSDPARATPLENYPGEHTTLGVWGNVMVANPLYNMGSSGQGMVIPPGFDSLLHIGRTGLGVPCYGGGTSDPALAGQTVPGFPDVLYCYDPTNADKGSHAYPYSYFVWAYDLHDLADVKAGRKQPWDVRPYAAWPLALPFAEPNTTGLAATIDRASGLIYLSQLRADPGSGYFSGPILHVFRAQ